MIFNSRVLALVYCLLVSVGCSTQLGEGGTPFSSSEGRNLTDDGADGSVESQNDGDNNNNGGNGGKDGGADGDDAGAKGGDDKSGNTGGGSAGGDDENLNKDDGEGNGSIGLDDTGGNNSIKCKYFDQSKRGTSAVTQKIDGGPSMAIDISKYTNGGGEKDGDDYLFQITVFDDNRNGNGDSLTSGRYPIYYNAIIRDFQSADCRVIAERSGDGERTNLGCFLGTTQIRMADGTDKQINQLKVGDQVWNPISRKQAWVNEFIKGPEKKAMYEIGYAGKGFMVVTEKHPFSTKAGMKQAHELTMVDELLGSDGRFHKMTHLKVRPVDPETVVYNLKLDARSGDPADHMVLADGMVTGDLQLQRTLEKIRSEAASPAVAKAAK